MNNTVEYIVSAAKLLGKKLGVVSTVTSDGKPESAFVYFNMDHEMNVYFATRADSRKYKNLMQNPHASFVIASEEPPQTIQLEGTAAVVADPDEQRTLFPVLISIMREGGFAAPVTMMMESELMFMKMTVTWARVGDFEIIRESGAFREVEKIVKI